MILPRPGLDLRRDRHLRRPLPRTTTSSRVSQVLWFDYGVRNIFGIPYGYRGLNPVYGYSPRC